MKTALEMLFAKTSHNIKITVLPVYLEEQSDPQESHFVWAYTVRLENNGDHTIQLLNRYWHITDAQGMVQEVHGVGVIGEQPVLEAGGNYQYTSGAALKTPSGVMTGHYEMSTDEGELILVDIPMFSLDSPEQAKRPN